jgi:RNA-directed DNA polymerase
MGVGPSGSDCRVRVQTTGSGVGLMAGVVSVTEKAGRYTFQLRRAKNRKKEYFVGFLPAISAKAATAIRATIREWRLASARNNQRLEDLAQYVNPKIRGWMNYYGRFYRSKCVHVLRHLNAALAAWVRRKYTRFRRRERASMHWLGRIAATGPELFVLWQLGVKPEAGL